MLTFFFLNKVIPPTTSTVTEVETKTVISTIPGPTVVNTQIVSIPGPTIVSTQVQYSTVAGPVVIQTQVTTEIQVSSVAGPTVTNTEYSTVKGPTETQTVASTQYQISTVSSVYTETEWFAATATVTITHTETEISTLPAQTIKETQYCEFKILLSVIHELLADFFANQVHAFSNLTRNYNHKHRISGFYFNSTSADP